MWLCEQITARGVGNGTSLIIMSGIVAGLPHALAGLLELSRQGAISWPLVQMNPTSEADPDQLAKHPAVCFGSNPNARSVLADSGWVEVAGMSSIIPS
jgi:hypothetical protein